MIYYNYCSLQYSCYVLVRGTILNILNLKELYEVGICVWYLTPVAETNSSFCTETNKQLPFTEGLRSCVLLLSALR